MLEPQIELSIEYEIRRVFSNFQLSLGENGASTFIFFESDDLVR